MPLIPSSVATCANTQLRQRMPTTKTLTSVMRHALRVLPLSVTLAMQLLLARERPPGCADDVLRAQTVFGLEEGDGATFDELVGQANALERARQPGVKKCLGDQACKSATRDVVLDR